MRNKLHQIGLAIILVTFSAAQPPGEASSGTPGAMNPGNLPKGRLSPEEIEAMKQRILNLKENKPITIQGENGAFVSNSLPMHIQIQMQKQVGAANEISKSGDSPLFRVRNIMSAYQSLVPSVIEDRIIMLESKGFFVERLMDDPFGLSMNGEPPKSNVPTTEENIKERPPSLQDAVQTLIIHGVMPSRREFLSEGGQNIFEGDRIQLAYQGINFNARVERVEEGRIVFRDRATGDRAILPIALSPQKGLLQTIGTNGTSFLRPMPPVNPVQGRND